MAETASLRNHVLKNLTTADLRLLEPHLEPVKLPLRKVLERAGKLNKAVYFLEDGMASVVADAATRPIEVGVIGREGMTGLPLLLGAARSDSDIYMQAPGHGHCLREAQLRLAVSQSDTLRASLLCCVHVFLQQTTRTVVANGRSKIEERLARWLLMADDRIDGDELPLTHEFLAMMLGVRRPGVTEAIQTLERGGAIVRKRGSIIVVDRNRLKKLSNGTYFPIN